MGIYTFVMFAYLQGKNQSQRTLPDHIIIFLIILPMLPALLTYAKSNIRIFLENLLTFEKEPYP